MFPICISGAYSVWFLHSTFSILFVCLKKRSYEVKLHAGWNKSFDRMRYIHGFYKLWVIRNHCARVDAPPPWEKNVLSYDFDVNKCLAVFEFPVSLQVRAWYNQLSKDPCLYLNWGRWLLPLCISGTISTWYMQPTFSIVYI